MGIFNFNKRAKGKSTSSSVGVTTFTLKDPPDWLSGLGYHRLTDAPEVAAAIDIIAGLIASTPIHLMENKSNGDVRVHDGLARKIDVDPWRLGTRQLWVHWIVETMLTDGNAIVIPITAEDRIVDLPPAPGAGIYRDYGSPSYYAMYEGHQFDAGDILHFRYKPDPDYPWTGLGVQAQLQQVVDSILQTAATKTAYMSSEYKPPIIIAVNSDGPLNDKKKRNDFLEQYISQTKAGQPWVIPSDLMSVHQVKPLSLTDLAIKDGVELDKKTVATILDIPPFLLGVGSFNRDEYNAFVRRRLIRICQTIEQEMTKKLLWSESRYFRFNVRKLYSYTLQELATIARDLRGAGMMTGNEGRNWIDLPPKEGLDDLQMLENYIPVNMLGNQKKLNQTNTQEDTTDVQ